MIKIVDYHFFLLQDFAINQHVIQVLIQLLVIQLKSDSRFKTQKKL